MRSAMPRSNLPAGHRRREGTHPLLEEGDGRVVDAVADRLLDAEMGLGGGYNQVEARELEGRLPQLQREDDPQALSPPLGCTLHRGPSRRRANDRRPHLLHGRHLLREAGGFLHDDDARQVGWTSGSRTSCCSVPPIKKSTSWSSAVAVPSSWREGR